MRHLITILFTLYALITATAELRAQGDNCGSATNLGSISYHLNQTSNISGTYATSTITDAVSNPPVCRGASINPTVSGQDGWYRFTAANTVRMVIQYTSTDASADEDDAILEVYRQGGSDCLTDLQLLTCGNEVTNAPGTESVNISAVAGNEYYVRIISTQGDMSGFLSIYESSTGVADGDLCQDALDVSLGTCDFPFFVEAGFYNNEGRGDCAGFNPVNADPTQNTQQDGWLKFTATSNIQVGVSYQTTSGQDVGIEVYTGTCGNLSAVGGGCTVNQDKEFDVTTGTTYYIRILNRSNNAEMQGYICIYENYYRDDCADLLNAGTPISPLSLGDCNVRVNISGNPLSAADLTGAPSCAADETDPDSWVVFDATTSTIVRLDFSNLSGADAAGIVVYQETTCPSDHANEIASGCITSGGASTSSVSFSVTAGSRYFIRFLNGSGSDFYGSLCIYEDTKKAEDNFYTANTFLIDGSDCGRQFNVLSSFLNSAQDANIFQGGYPFPNTLSSSTDLACAGTTAEKDAWARFQVSGSPLAQGLVIEYNNDNNDPSIANNVAMLVYRTTLNAAVAAPANADVYTSAPTINADTPYTGFDVSSAYNTTDGDPVIPAFGDFEPSIILNHERWVRYDHAGAGNFTVVFEEGNTNNSNLYLYNATPTSGNELALSKATSADQVLTWAATAATYYIRVVSANPITGGQLTVYTEFELVDCIDAEENDSPLPLLGSGEGIERITLPNNLADGDYFIRIANTDDPGSTIGTLCIRPDVTTDGDICASAMSLLVGDCDLDFSLETTFNQTLEIDADANPMSCSATNVNSDPNSAANPRVSVDGWFRFVATASRTTIQYFSTQDNTANVDIALAAYRGSCGNLFFLGCVDEDPANNIEEITLNTIVGLEYFIRVMDINPNANGGEITGQLCIFNTTARDVCDDDDIVTRYVGDCNIPFEVEPGFENTGAAFRNFIPGDGDAGDPNNFPVTANNGSIAQSITSSCEATEPPFNAADNNPSQASARDGWMRFIGNGEEVTLTYETNSAGSNPAIVVYSALVGLGPVNCGVGINGAGNPENQYACVNNGSGAGAESVTLQTRSGQIYIVRIIDLNGAGMNGKLCIAEGAGNFDEACNARPVEMGQCSEPLNVIQGINTCYDPANENANYDDNNPGTCDDCTEGDAWALLQAPYACDSDLYDSEATGVTTNRGTNYDVENLSGTWTCTDGAGTALPWLTHRDPDGTPGNADDYCECSANTVPVSNFYSDISVQYDSEDGLLGEAPDAKLIVYGIDDPANCNDENAYTRVSCQNATTGEGLELVTIADALDNDLDGDVENGEGGGYYLIRVMNITAGQSLYGSLCMFYGTDIGSTNCTPGTEASMDNYGDLTGEFRSITTPRRNDDPNRGLPTSSIPNCVISGGSNPTSSNPPIRSDAWIKFSIPPNPADPTQPLYPTVTVQYANVDSEGNDLNPRDRNMAIAIYGPDNCPSNGDQPIDCANTVFMGTESLTITDLVVGDYFVRVMNVHRNSSEAYTGRIRVYPYAQCVEGPELVVDGNFAGWPGIIRGVEPIDPISGVGFSSGATDVTVAGETIPLNDGSQTVAQFDDNHYDDILTQPYLTTSDAYPNNDLDQNMWMIGGATVNTGIARFATQYGYQPDIGRNNRALPNGSSIRHTDGTTEDEWRRVRAFYADIKRTGDNTDEIGTGEYNIHKSSRPLRDYWTGYGWGYSGWGGGPRINNYCDAGRPGDGTQACDEIDVLGDGSFVTVGSYNDDMNRAAPLPATSDANYMVVDGSFDNRRDLFPSKIWCQTIERAGGNVGYYVFTLWVNNLFPEGTRGNVPMVRITICDMEDPNNPGTFSAVGDAGIAGTRLPGYTRADQTPVLHDPAPPTNRMRNARDQILYGAAMGCNTSTESLNARLKTLGSSFLIEEYPDNWVMVRCIYRAARQVSEFNVCVENLSLQSWGNNIGLDNFSMRECENADAQAFDRMLKGDPCELADDPTALGIPLPATMLDFSGILIGETVFLNWTTIQEYNNNRFEVQRSTNGLDFTPIGNVDAKGNGASYNFVDRKLPNGARKLYYRLNMIDNDGLEKLGPVVEVDIAAREDFDLKIIPNPQVQGNEVEVEFNVPEGRVAIEVADMVGNILHKDIVETTEGLNRYDLATAQLEPGVYIIRITSQGRKISKKLMVL